MKLKGLRNKLFLVWENTNSNFCLWAKDTFELYSLKNIILFNWKKKKFKLNLLFNNNSLKFKISAKYLKLIFDNILVPRYQIYHNKKATKIINIPEVIKHPLYNLIYVLKPVTEQNIQQDFFLLIYPSLNFSSKWFLMFCTKYAGAPMLETHIFIKIRQFLL